MRWVPLEPPGSWCQNHAVLEMVRRSGARTFLEVGCGRGTISAGLCRMGLTGAGVEFSNLALPLARESLGSYIAADRFRLVEEDFMELALGTDFDIALSLMVMEHVEDDLGFLRRLRGPVRPGGHVLVAVPAQERAWSLEDELAGHYRRYHRQGLESLMVEAELEAVEVWSVSVPVANILFGLSRLAIGRSAEARRDRDRLEGTRRSGVWAIPFKTVYPAWFRLLLNRFTMAPLVHGQRLFYRTDWGLTMVAMGRVSA